MNTLIKKAYTFAELKHKDQFRKFTTPPLPYFLHPRSVGNILLNITKEQKLVIVGYLHDTLEDTDTTEHELNELFGCEITNLVVELTSIKEDIKKVGKTQYLINKMNNMSHDAFTVKLADRYHNVMFLEYDGVPLSFVRKYYNETVEIINQVKRESISEHQRILIDGINVTLKFLKLRFNL